MMARLPGPSIFFSLALLSKSMRSVSALFRKASRKSRRVAPKAKENKSTPTFVSTPVSPSNANKRPKSSPKKVRSASGVPSTKGKHVKTNVLYVHVPNGGNRVTVHGINNGMYYTMAGDPLGTLHKNPSFIPHKHLPPLAPSAPLPPLPPLPPSQRVKDRMTAIREKIVELGDSTHHSRINELERIRNRIKSIQAKHGAERYRHPRNNALQNNLSARRHPPSYTNRQLKTLLENYARLLQKKYPNLLELN